MSCVPKKDKISSPVSLKRLPLIAGQFKAREIVRSLIDIHSSMEDLQYSLDGLEPGENVNGLFSKLVSLCLQIHDKETVEQVFKSAELRRILNSLRGMCSEAEYLLEMHWAERIALAPDAGAAATLLQSFPYYANYEELTRLEINALLSVEPKLPAKVAFVGSGPLPLTSLQFLWALESGSLPGSYPAQGLSYRMGGGGAGDDIELLNIDHDEPAIRTAKALVAKLGPRGRGMSFMNAAAESDAYDLRRFDVVYLAALVGETQSQKENLLLKVAAKMREGALIVMRTSWGLRSCLYPEIDITTEKMLRAVEICNVVHPYGRVVNSVVVARVKQRGGSTAPSPLL